MTMRLTLAAPALLVAMCAATPMAWAYTGQELAPQARIDLAVARKIALAASSGTITDQELEREPGGSGLRYSFDVRRGGKTIEVGVDATTGAVLENQAEGAHPD